MRPWRSALDARVVWGSIRSRRLANWRVTRAELCAAAGASDTRLKVHLARLTELEYLLVYRALRRQDYVYELLQDQTGQDGKNNGKGPHVEPDRPTALQACSCDA